MEKKKEMIMNSLQLNHHQDLLDGNLRFGYTCKQGGFLLARAYLADSLTLVKLTHATGQVKKLDIFCVRVKKKKLIFS